MQLMADDPLAGTTLNIQGVLCRPMLLLAQQASVP